MEDKPQKITKMQTIKDKVKNTTVALVGAAKFAAKAVSKQGTIIGGVLGPKQKPIKTPSVKSKAASAKSSLKSKTPAASKGKGKAKGVTTEDAVVPFDRAAPMPSLLESVAKNSAWREKGADTGLLEAIMGIGLDPAKRAEKRIDNLITQLADGMSPAEEDAVIVIKVDEMCRELLKKNLEPFEWCTFDLYVPDDDVMISPQAKLIALEELSFYCNELWTRYLTGLMTSDFYVSTVVLHLAVYIYHPYAYLIYGSAGLSALFARCVLEKPEMKDPFIQYFVAFLQTARQGTVAFLQAQQNEDLVEIYEHHLN